MCCTDWSNTLTFDVTGNCEIFRIMFGVPPRVKYHMEIIRITCMANTRNFQIKGDGLYSFRVKTQEWNTINIILVAKQK